MERAEVKLEVANERVTCSILGQMDRKLPETDHVDITEHSQRACVLALGP